MTSGRDPTVDMTNFPTTRITATEDASLAQFFSRALSYIPSRKATLFTVVIRAYIYTLENIRIQRRKHLTTIAGLAKIGISLHVHHSFCSLVSCSVMRFVGGFLAASKLMPQSSRRARMRASPMQSVVGAYTMRVMSKCEKTGGSPSCTLPAALSPFPRETRLEIFVA